MVRTFKKFYNRDLPIYSAQYWYIGEKESLPGYIENSTNLSPLFISVEKQGVGIHYDKNIRKSALDKMFQYFLDDSKRIEKICKLYEDVYVESKDILKNVTHDDIQALFNLNANKILPILTILMQVGKLKGKKWEKIAKHAVKSRTENDKVIYSTGLKIYDLIQQKFPNNDDLANLVTIEEAVSGMLPSEEELNRRRKGWILLDGKLHSGIDSVEDFLKSKDVVIDSDSTKMCLDIRGTVAYKGCVSGIVKTIFTTPDIFKVKEGEIIVSPMTTPDFMIAIRKAAAIVTDEGGITCHAAIVARELKKPCIIGTKISTQILKDGDFIEVDGHHGIVHILKRN